MHTTRLDRFRRYKKEHQRFFNILSKVLPVAVVSLFIIAIVVYAVMHDVVIRDKAANICNTYLADENVLDEYGAITFVIQDFNKNYYVFTYSGDPTKLYDCKGNYDHSYNGRNYGVKRIPGCRYDADELLKLTCGDKVDTTDISDDIFGTEKKPKNVVRIIAGELKASLKKEISLSR